MPMSHPTRILLAALTLLSLACGSSTDSPDAAADSAVDSAADAAVLPEPAADYFEPGPFPVGNTRVTLTDSARTRALPVEIWYPAAESARAAAETGQAMTDFEMEPPRSTELARLVAEGPTACLRTTTGAAASPEPAAAPTSWPIVIVSHCHACTRFDLAAIAERLASFGIAAAAPDHEGNTLWDELVGTSASPGSEFLEVRVADLRFVLDALLDATNSELPDNLRGRFDGSRAATLGHSFGSATAGITAARDPRFLAAVAIAAPVTALGGGVASSDIDTPMLFLLAKEDNSITEIGNRLIRTEHRRVTGPSVLVEIEDAGHWSFSDHAGMIELFEPGCGSGMRQTAPAESFDYLDNDVARDLAADVSVAFLARYLLDDPGGTTPIQRGHPSGLTTVSALRL